jgi:hypothetical protein
MNVQCEPAVFVLRRVVRALVRHLTEIEGAHITYAQARQVIAGAVGCRSWDDLRGFDVQSTAALIFSLTNGKVWRNGVAPQLATLGIGSSWTDATLGDFSQIGFAPGKPASRLSAMLDDRMAFHGIQMGSGGWYEHRDAPKLMNSARTVGRRVTSTSDGIVGMDRSLFLMGGHERLLLDDAVEQKLNTWGCAPFLFANSNQTIELTSAPQFLHGSWAPDFLFLAGNGEASGLVAQIGEWHRRGEMCMRSNSGLFVGHRDAPDVADLRPCFVSGWEVDRE